MCLHPSNPQWHADEYKVIHLLKIPGVVSDCSPEPGCAECKYCALSNKTRCPSSSLVTVFSSFCHRQPFASPQTIWAPWPWPDWDTWHSGRASIVTLTSRHLFNISLRWLSSGMGLDGYEEQRRGPLEAVPNQQNKGPAANRSLKTRCCYLNSNMLTRPLIFPPTPSSLSKYFFQTYIVLSLQGDPIHAIFSSSLYSSNAFT